MDQIEIKNQIINLLELFIKNIQGGEQIIKEYTGQYDQLLNLIITDSKLAINFIVLLEDEFDIAIDDDVINLNFFESVGWISEIIHQQLRNDR